MRRAPALGAVALTIWTVLGVAHAQAGPESRELQMILRGRGRAAEQMVARQLLQSPQDPRLHTLLGMSLGTEGRWADSLGPLAQGEASELYWTHGIKLHALALRYTGQAEQAIPLYEQLILTPVPGEDPFYTWMDLSDTWREAGDPDKTLATLETALAYRPDGLKPNAMLAELHLDIGDLETADSLLQLSAQRMGGFTPPRVYQVRTRLLLAQGLTEEAGEMVQRGRAVSRWDPRLVALHAEVYLQQGRPDLAWELLERPNVRYREEPVLLAAQVRTLRSLGRESEAEIKRARLHALNPRASTSPEAVPLTPQD